MKRIILPLAAIIMAVTFAPITFMGGAAHAAETASASKVDATKAVLRDLWLNHIFWARNVVIASLNGDTEAAKVAEKETVENAQAIAGAIEPFYGAEAKEQLFKLLADHYGAIKSYLEASMSKNVDGEKKATDQLLANAEELASFLSGANPNLPKEDVLGLLQAHGGHHMGQIQQLIAKDYDGEAETWAAMSQHMYVIADTLADAIAKQFPAKF